MAKAILEKRRPLKHFSLEKARTNLEILRSFFDIARLVDPAATAIVEIDEQNQLHRQPYSCFHVWNREQRCQNCSSMCAMLGGSQRQKYEACGDSVFYIASKPVLLEMEDGQLITVVLELVTKMEDDPLFPQDGTQNWRDVFQDTWKKIYEDPLTKAYNRRYLDEGIFLFRTRNEIATQLGLIFIDMKNFKHINDTYGHSVGDRVLMDVAAVLKKGVRNSDSVMRIGGDEFLVALADCPEQEVVRRMNFLKEAVGEVTTDSQSDEHVQADCGYAYEENFTANPKSVQELVDQADAAMYREKTAPAAQNALANAANSSRSPQARVHPKAYI